MTCTRRVCSLALLASACAATDDGPAWTELGAWRTHVVHAGDLRLSGVAAGDLDPRTPGDEVLAVGERGALVLARVVDGTFRSTVLEEAGGELLQVAIGELDRAAAGHEAVAVGVLTGAEGDGGPGVAWLLTPSPEGLVRTELHRSAALLHAVVIAELDPRGAGLEVALAGFTREVLVLSRGAEGFVPRVVASLPGNAKGMAATRRGLAVACDDGSLVVVERPRVAEDPAAPWRVAYTWRGAAPLARVAARGDEVLVCDNNGVLRLLQFAAGGAFERELVCYTASDRLRGAVFADVDPRTAGTEAATGGYDGTVHSVRLTPHAVPDDVVPASAGFHHYRVELEPCGADTGRVHHLAAGGFAGLGGSVGPVTALVSAGHSGRVLAFDRLAGR